MLKYKTKYFNFDKEAVSAIQKSEDSAGETPSTYEIKGIFTDETPDSHGDIITREGTIKALPDYREWRNIRYMHQPKAVGLAKHIGKDDGAELDWNEIIIKLVDKETIHQVQEGVLKGLSVGILFNPFDSNACEWLEDGGWKIKEYMLAEISVVDHPAHPNASIIESALEAVADREIPKITESLKMAIRTASSSEELVPLLKALSIEKEKEMPKTDELINEEVEVEKEGRDWDKERNSPESTVEPTEVEEVEEANEETEEIEEAVETSETVEEEEETHSPSNEEEVTEETAIEIEAESATEKEVVEEAEVESEEETEEVEEEIDEPDVKETEEELEEELPESNESEELSIEVSEGLTIEERLDKLEALLLKVLETKTEDIQVAEVETEANTDVVVETKEKDLVNPEESITPSNRKSNVEVDSIEIEEESTKSGTTFFRKRADSTTRIRRILDNFEL